MANYGAELRRALLRTRPLKVTLDDDIRLAAMFALPVLITAEYRDRRDLCARVIHATGEAARGPFVTLTLDGDDLQARRSILPWRADGAGVEAFIRQKFEHAHGGTLFVDDLVTASVEVQAQLLRLLDEPVSGSYAPRYRAGMAVRIIAGASRHLDAEHSNGRFNEPLFYRLNVIHLDLTSPSREFP